MSFKKKLLKIVGKNDSLLCIGLDVDKEKIPSFLFKTSKNPFLDFNRSIINATRDLVCAYKLNMAFYEVLGSKGLTLLKRTIQYIPRDIVVILDGKRNDIGNTARKYAQTQFETFSADAATVNPYLGEDAIKPFLEFRDKCTFILCRTSNTSAVDLQDLLVIKKVPLYQEVARLIKKWNIYGNCGVVVGATYPHELKIIRGIMGDEIPLLIPGIGAQGGNVETTVKNGVNKYGEMAIINSSRGIIYAGGDESFSQASRVNALYLKDEINKYR